MNKNYFCAIGLASLLGMANAQSFTDNFDGYSAGAFLGTASSGKWTTWTNSPGGADDVKVSNAKAHSGSNAVYFSSAVTTGGPVDCVLPFGGQYNTGTFAFSMWMFVETGKSAYFNWQEQSTLGKGWTFDLNMDASGNLKMNNTTGGNLFASTYTQNQWFKLEINVDLNTNTWELLIDNVSKGKFQNTYRQVAAMDIFPLNGNGFFIDDVSYTYTASSKPANDAAVTYIGNVAGFLAGSAVVPSVEIRNLGTSSITSADIDLIYNGNTQSKKLTGINLAPLAVLTVKMDAPIVILSGKSTITATVTKMNGSTDDNTANNAKSIVLDPVVPAAGKLVIAEEATGTWCGWCPRGAVMLKSMHEKYSGFFQGIAVHNNDTMMNGIYDRGLSYSISGYPSALVDRNPKIDPSAIETDFLTRILTAPHGTFNIAAKYSDPNTLKVCVTVHCTQNISGNYKIACVLTEDSITGKGTKFNQANYYSGGGNGVMGGFETLSNPVPAAKMVYDHVARAIAPSFLGLNNAFGGTKNTGDEMTFVFNYSMGNFWIPKRMHIVPMLIDPSGKIDNGGSISLIGALNNSWTNGAEVLASKELDAPDDIFSVYPNPVSDLLNIQLNAAKSTINIFDASGRVIYTTSSTDKALNINTRNWAKGIYVARVTSEMGMQTKKFVKE